jgi:hypothetical protein
VIERAQQGKLFVSGILIEKQCEYEAIYHLTFLLDGSVIIPVYSTAPREGRAHSAGGQMQVGRRYHLLLQVRPHRLRWLEAEPAGGLATVVAAAHRQVARDASGVSGERIVLQHHIVQGRVVDVDWRRAEERYVLLETAIGRVVLSPRALEAEARESARELVPGTWLAWRPWRLDLLAVLEGP